MDARLIVDAPAPGAWNMAVDEALFRGLAPHGPAVIRLYRWCEPTLSLGYFQGWRERDSHPPSRQLPLVRRASGGGAIVHDAELTYSVIFPAANRPAVARQLLMTVHQSLVDELSALGIALRQNGPVEDRPGDEPFLCFLRRSEEDLILNDHKVVGSAQRRQRSGILQHGSILLRRSSSAPQLAGIQDLVPPAPDVNQQLLDAWPRRLARQLNLRLVASQLSDKERVDAGRLVEERFAASPWTRKR